MSYRDHRRDEDDRDEGYDRPRDAGFPLALVGGALVLLLLVGGAAGYYLLRSRARVAQERDLAVAEAELARAAGRSAAPGNDPTARVWEPEKDAGPVSPWAEAPEGSAELGGVRVRVTDAAVGRVQEGGKEAPGVALIFQVEVTNETPDRVDYRGWDTARLTDAAGTAYKLRRRGEKPGDTVEPGKKLLDVLVFDRPSDGAGTLELELPASVVGGSGTYRIRIPQAVWDRPAPAKD